MQRKNADAFVNRINAKIKRTREEILAANTMINILRKTPLEALSTIQKRKLESYGLSNFGREATMKFLKNLATEKKNEIRAREGATA